MGDEPTKRIPFADLDFAAIEEKVIAVMASNGPLYPDVVVKLAGCDGNVFIILGAVKAALRKADVPAEKLGEFWAEATADDFDHVLKTCMKWVTVL
jgi:hypothetical protein